jgi:hypothetical protein
LTTLLFLLEQVVLLCCFEQESKKRLCDSKDIVQLFFSSKLQHSMHHLSSERESEHGSEHGSGSDDDSEHGSGSDDDSEHGNDNDNDSDDCVSAATATAECEAGKKPAMSWSECWQLLLMGILFICGISVGVGISIAINDDYWFGVLEAHWSSAWRGYSSFVDRQVCTLESILVDS